MFGARAGAPILSVIAGWPSGMKGQSGWDRGTRRRNAQILRVQNLS